jgi:hypothetical protein
MTLHLTGPAFRFFETPRSLQPARQVNAVVMPSRDWCHGANLIVNDLEISRVLSLDNCWDAVRDLLANDKDASALRFLERELPTLTSGKRRGIANCLAGHYCQKGDLEKVRQLFATNEDEILEGALGALCAEPRANPAFGPGIVALAIEAAEHPGVDVRVGVCILFQNQCAWGTDVTAAIEPLRTLLADPNEELGQPAAFAVGNLAKKKYDVSRLIPELRRNLKRKNQFVHGPAAWALWQITRAKLDISAAVPELVKALQHKEDWNEPRKNAAAALLHHAKKSAENAQEVRKLVRAASLDSKRKEIKNFLADLASVK